MQGNSIKKKSYYCVAVVIDQGDIVLVRLDSNLNAESNHCDEIELIGFVPPYTRCGKC